MTNEQIKELFKTNPVLDSPPDSRDWKYKDIACVSSTVTTLPDSFELTYQFSPKSQNSQPACVAFTISEMKEMIDAEDEQLSPSYIYYNRASSDTN